MLKIYQCCQEEGKKNDYGSADLLAKLTQNAEKIVCDSCGYNCGNIWYSLENKSIDSFEKLPGIICTNCVDRNTFSKEIIKKHYKISTLLEEICYNKKNQQLNWTEEDQIELIHAMEEFQCDMSKIKEKFPSRSINELIRHYLVTPLKEFSGILKLTYQQFEIIFKKDNQKKQNDISDEGIAYQVR